ncbi:peroxisomal 2,4-dienoyl-CoA reductase [(3E)-enoyl-CoA-producing]-like [Mercenaria mercenaria]|uniref:peroxisomal 2,4-dienoyl-CoA reductase [(3E)-enoyl-CoA-producing]-like n=1 Tax=Mercenaria mercenaria TaxID=6596 RepID=UPI00234E3B2E|nr:peroxisomal 2,4-dienoyl-CoA reductase [(3E)-enoyl-CoA-producing]-like [Mercenaria mercenaria]
MSQSAASSKEKCIDGYKYLFNKDLLKGQVAFVTGGGTGIGFTIAEVLMSFEGCILRGIKNKVSLISLIKIVQHAVRFQSLLLLEKLLANSMDPDQAGLDPCWSQSHYIRFHMARLSYDFKICCLFYQPKKVQAAVGEAMRRFGKINFLINSAAGNFLCPAEGLSFNAFRTVMDIDTMGTFNTTKVVFDEYMKKHGGVIINVTATLQVRGQVYQLHAGCAKAAIETMTKHLAVEWGEKGIRVMCVAPGPISDTEGFSRLGGKTISDEYVKNIPIQRLGKREDIANTVLYCVSDAAQLLTGTTVIADGGAWLTSENSLRRVRRIMEMHAKM